VKVLIVVPAYNEEKVLEANILKILDFCQKNLKADFEIVIVDNQSTDATGQIAQRLANQYPAVHYLGIDQKGKGFAIKSGWQSSSADVYCFMDADLATDLSALPALVEGISAGYDLVCGNRFDPQSKIKRSGFRRLVSFVYRRVLKMFLAVKIDDAPCGFKAVNHQVRVKLLAQVKNQAWFFDSELVILAEKLGYKIKQIPVTWVEPRTAKDKSRVKVFSLALNYFREIWRLRKQLP